MGLFDGFPFTTMHQLNLDWIIRTTKKADEKADAASANASTAAVQAASAAAQAASAEAKADKAIEASGVYNIPYCRPGENPQPVKIPGKTVNGRSLYEVVFYTENVAEDGEWIVWYLPETVTPSSIVSLSGVNYDEDQGEVLPIGYTTLRDYQLQMRIEYGSVTGPKLYLLTDGDPINPNPNPVHIHLVYMGERV